jgi:hypothetical protein
MSSIPEVRPLTARNAAGLLYMRFEATEIQIGMMLFLLHPAWILAAPDLLAETLVCLIRETHGRDDELFGLLAAELSKRVYRIGGAFARGFDLITKEDILWRVEQQIFKLVLAETPSRQSDFLEIAFGQAVERLTNNAVGKHNASTWGRREVLAGPNHDDDDGDDEIERSIADGGPGPDENVLHDEDQAVQRKWYWKVCRVVENPMHLDALRLRCCEGYSIEDLMTYFNATRRQVRYALETAKKQIRKAFGAQAPAERKPDRAQRAVSINGVSK